MKRNSAARPALSVIIPVFNSSGDLEACLRALEQSEYPPAEVIVVDDASSDDSAEVARRSGANVISLPRNSGPAAARNAGAAVASAPVLVFFDADTQVHPDTLGLIADRFAAGRLDALFGSYDDAPADPGLVSRFRNLLHCYTHHDAPRVANTFWAGCGAVRAQAFHAAAGFDERYTAPATEDVELGMRLARQGRRIEIDPAIQVKHRKRWTLSSMARTDLLMRAMPLGELLVRERRYPKVLGVRQLASVILLAVLLPWLTAALHFGLLLGLLAYLALNRKFLLFLSAKGGPGFAAVGLFLLLFHHLCGVLGAAAGALRHIGRALAASPAALAVFAALLVASWWTLTVHINFHGQWTALFCTGESRDLPPALTSSTFRFKASPGYDGQFYRLVAHDPFMTRGYSAFADAPSVRWRRILVPAAAWLLAAGSPKFIDAAFILVILLSAALGVYGLSRWLQRRQKRPVGGLVFLLLPGTLISLDRMTVDVALYSLIFLCLLWDDERRFAPLWFGLALCVLVRDLGFLVVAAFVLASAAARHWRRAACLASSVIPAVAWYLVVRLRLSSTSLSQPEVAPWAFHDAGYGIFLYMLNPTHYPLPPVKAALALILDEVALAALVAAVVLTLVGFRWRTTRNLEWLGFLFAALFFAANAEGFWRDLFSWARAYTPLLAALALTAGPSQPLRWLPLAAVTLRVGLQFGTQVEGLFRGA